MTSVDAMMRSVLASVEAEVEQPTTDEDEGEEEEEEEGEEKQLVEEEEAKVVVMRGWMLCVVDVQVEDVEDEDVEEDVLDDHEQDLCVSIPLSKVVKIFLFTFTFHSRFKLSDCKV